MMRFTRREALRAIAGAASFGLLARAEKLAMPHLIWRRPAASAAEILRYGPAGRDKQPQPPFRFEEEDLGGTNPKIKIRDAAGAFWIVKWGEEVHSEAFASRLAACAGYFVRTAVYAFEGRIDGVGDLQRAKDSVDSSGQFNDAVMKLIELDRPYAEGVNWSWTNNPFLSSQEDLVRLNGLKMVLMLTSNWDNKDGSQQYNGVNTAIYEEKRGGAGAHLYAFDDWGATMGRWGGLMDRSKWDAAGFQDQTAEFVLGVDTDGYVEWGFDGKSASDLKSGIRPADVAALLEYLGGIAREDLQAGLEVCGATPEEDIMFSGAVLKRLDQLKTVAS